MPASWQFFQRILFSALTLLGIKRPESTALHLVSFYARGSSYGLYGTVAFYRVLLAFLVLSNACYSGVTRRQRSPLCSSRVLAQAPTQRSAGMERAQVLPPWLPLVVPQAPSGSPQKATMTPRE